MICQRMLSIESQRKAIRWSVLSFLFISATTRLHCMEESLYHAYEPANIGVARSLAFDLDAYKETEYRTGGPLKMLIIFD